jgi:hypothetical protein
MNIKNSTGIYPLPDARASSGKGNEKPEQRKNPSSIAPMKLILLATLFSPLYAQAAIHYVRQGASGNGSGSDWSNAYTSLPSNLVRGDTYYVAAGSYAGRTFNTPASGTAVITIKKAIEADHGTNTGWQSSYGTGQTVFNTQIGFSTPYWVFDGQTGGGPGSWTSGFGFRINHTGSHAVVVSNSGDNVTMRHVELQGNSTDGVQGFRLTGADNFTLSYWYTENIGNCPFFMVPVSNFLAEYGYVGKFSGSSSNHSEIASIWGGVKGTTTFRYNIFANVTSTGGLMWDNSNDHTAQLRVYGNVFYKSPTSRWENNANGLIGGWTGGGGEDLYNLRIYNNTFYNTTGTIFTDFVTRSGDNEVKNNIFYNSSAPGYNDIQSHDYNHYINSGGTQSEAKGTSATSGDPFVNAAGLDFNLKADTAAGLTLASPYNVDPMGTLRGVSGIFDRGAFQYKGSNPSIVLTPPTNLRSM